MNAVSKLSLIAVLLASLAVVACDNDRLGLGQVTPTPTSVRSQTVADGKSAILAVQKIAGFGGCNGEFSTSTSSQFLFVGCGALEQYGGARWYTQPFVVNNRQTGAWSVSFGGYDQSAVIGMWSAEDDLKVLKWLGSVSKVYWIWKWDSTTGEIELIRADWPANGVEVCGPYSPC
jgi:hypothetical protein